MQEIDVEELLAHHPYLIARKLAGTIPRRQISKGACRLDLAFETKAGLSIAELKKVELHPKHISQLLKYCRVWSVSRTVPLANEHYLIGKKPANTGALEKALARSRRKIHLRYFGEHIPRTLMMIGREYQAYDESIYSPNVVRIRI